MQLLLLLLLPFVASGGAAGRPLAPAIAVAPGDVASGK